MLHIKCEFVLVNRVPHVNIDIENSKFELHKKDNIKIHKLTQEKEFINVICAKVDVNLKIAKVLANSLDWSLDFNAFKGAKYTLRLPLPNAEMSP